MNSQNDTLLTTNNQNKDFTTCPTINEIKKEDNRYHHKKKIKNTKTPARLFCQLCGHELPISDSILKRVNRVTLSRQAKLQSRHMGRRERHRRAVLAGLARAKKAGQTLKPKTIKKCTGRKIYRQVASELQIHHPHLTLV